MDETCTRRAADGAGETMTDAEGAMTLAAIDVGTVSTRLIVSEVDAAGRTRPFERQARITNLGMGVDATGRLEAAAIERTVACVTAYGRRVAELAREAREGHGASEGNGTHEDGAPAARWVTITLTSAARDAANADDLLGALRARGLDPQVIPGDVEARLALLGVTSDFPGQDVLVADVGGGSTELVCGRRDADGLHVGRGHSFDVGCRRVTERFFGTGGGIPPTDGVRAARAFVRETLGAFFADDFAGAGALAAGDAIANASSASASPASPAPFVAPRTLVGVGGTATSLVAVAHELVPYDPAFVHLRRMPRDLVRDLARRLLAMDVEQRRALPGLQPKRADVIAAGALIIDELMDVGGYDAYVASESDSLIGLLTCEYAAAHGVPGPLAPLWDARVTDAATFCDRCLAVE